MATPSTMKQWTITGTQKGFDDLKFEEVKVPAVGEYEVLVKLGATSLNYRDLIIPMVRKLGLISSILPHMLQLST